AAAKLGKGSEKFAMHIKGVEMTGYDVRGLKTCALGYAVSRRGADHQRHGAYGPDLKGQVDRFKAEKGRGQLVIDGEDLYSIMDSLIICKFSRRIWDYEMYAKMYSLATGIPMTGEEMQRCGERISNLGKIYNLREGIGREEDTLPIRCMKDPIKSGIAKGSLVTQEELDLLLDDYYETRGWSKEGIPTNAKLKELGLMDYAEYLEDVKKAASKKKKDGKKKSSKKKKTKG
ncbi:MAG: aldehyde ferredoxin oxidoreductase C-terminal domain-containing protein, partial [Promethearchaeia archaeon]